ncbi:hypothetical protein [Methylophaga sp. OBS3]|uniref:hypothetical protein n=1 Tax=Methylophaga sp. OBS3 TaxID=2991934 RepID=UPI0022586C55|nr:hypothetical protein [Methylophaga sp. OBS3]MCX4189573.1 hypothetical protein [Methylophaga sp. OBS3]
MKKLTLLIVGLLPLFVTGCVHHHYHEPEYQRGGPPPHAPAHGYRHKHYNHDLEFDSRLGVYAVIGRPDYYYWDSRYYRYYDGYWQFAADLDGRWYRDDGHVPRQLYRSYGGNDNHQGRGKGQGNGRGPGKGKGNGNGRGNSQH